MKKTILFTCLTALLAACSGKSAVTAPDETTVQPVNLILDTDLGPDYDDVGAMALMHALADSGQVNILAVVSSNKDEHVVPCIEVLNTYFNRPDIPVGAPKSEGGVSLTTWHKTKWTEELPARYPHKTAKTSDASDAVKVYRRILSTQPDSSVVVCTIGFFTNLKDLLLSGGDEYSPLSGCDLVAKKVKRVVSMAGLFPEGKEFNVYCDTPASRVVAERWPTEIIFSGFEIGNMIFTGKKLVQMDVGVLGAKAILNALSENGEAETAYKVAAQDTYPSWGCWIANGATTLLENWDLNATRDISDNHMMFGEIGGWFYKGLGGIFPDPQQPGFKHILLRPNFPSDLKQFEARHRSPYGEIQSQWERKKKSVVYSVTIPANSSATLYVPDTVKGERVIELEAGKHTFEWKLL